MKYSKELDDILRKEKDARLKRNHYSNERLIEWIDKTKSDRENYKNFVCEFVNEIDSHIMDVGCMEPPEKTEAFWKKISQKYSTKYIGFDRGTISSDIGRLLFAFQKEKYPGDKTTSFECDLLENVNILRVIRDGIEESEEVQ